MIASSEAVLGGYAVDPHFHAAFTIAVSGFRVHIAAPLAVHTEYVPSEKSTSRILRDYM